MIFTPTVHRWNDGYLAIDWPQDKPDTTMISRDVLLAIVEQLNELTELKASLEASS